ncbi:nucleotidyltransferase domain-containing protein [Pectobacterium brasiliense]|uniref:nucleotidyltransferase domain-containing protein n=1 Tax=Pectobacterium brasiliense TaxID=180957 RepID=UPI00057F1596|nr:nucleotidyltransferase domain-containing protein [Pectobacterium brasiliense]KHS95853.1 nucleotidyltransferase [Pectobacterium brasiliense]MBN3099942.1 nucleotidyltransferase domain-containing protein [Pectobacterium brasiliense]MBN3102290.1 nucleotidyltransferase domain-containing protein [Pectobacterium brasiliense]MBN3167576.1 nucleotidyltransferase domain-containing protein [Pectobacterium brasiliense]MBN3184111.1 nucleotidyltransferase domain-containing protein [Pectobacterium brasilie
MMEHDYRVDAAMRTRVKLVLQDVEERYQVKVLYACESGSRGWGFASPDSDYDVRFLYVHRPEWYLRVEQQRDVIELPIDDELDVCGWEWRKALGLLKRANPTLIEWLDSPVVYQEDRETASALRAAVPTWFSPSKACWHYLSMARKNFRGYLQDETVRLKKYFYVLRPLLAVRWIEAGKGMPPMRFSQLLAGTVDDPYLLAEIHQLLEIKQRSGEAEYGPRREVIHAFITKMLNDADNPAVLPDSQSVDDTMLDALLYRTVMA